MLEESSESDINTVQRPPAMLQAITAASKNQAHKENFPPQSNQAIHRDTSHGLASGATAEDDLNAQTRILQLRKSRFKASTVAPRNVTPLSFDFYSPTGSNDPDSPSTAMAPPLDHKDSVGMITEDCDAVQEISNSSLRRRGMRRPRTSLRRSLSHSDETLRSSPCPQNALLTERPTLNNDTFASPLSGTSGPTSTTTSPSKIPTVRRQPKTTTRKRRSSNGFEASQYIEHLESQLAALQTQLTSLTSPSTSKAHSIKLRAMNNESRLLRQEVQDWEQSFSERLHDQMEQHQIVVGSLRAQVRSLEREAEMMQERLETFETETDEKDVRLKAMDAANCELERRLELMSELLAASPSKLDLCQQPMESRKISPTRPKSFGLPLSKSTLPPLSPLRRLARHSLLESVAGQIHDDYVKSPESPSAKRHSRHWSFDRRQSQISIADSSDTLVTDGSEGMPAQDRPLSPTHRRLNLQRTQTDADARTRPSRQMRRFHGGAAGPRTLILPAASVSNSLPASAHTTAALDGPFPDPAQSTDLSQSFRSSRNRSATWNDDEASVSHIRRNESLSNRTPTANRRAVPITPLLAPPYAEAMESSSAQTKISRTSVGFADGGSLFEEFKSLQSGESSNSSGSEDASTSHCGKHRGSPLPTNPISAREDELPDDHVFNLTLPTLSPRVAGVVDGSPHDRTLPEQASMPAQLLSTLMSAVSRSIDRQAPTVRHTMTNAWDVVTLSRPVLEFRWWLIKLLIGDLRRRRSLWPRTPTKSPRHWDRPATTGLQISAMSPSTPSKATNITPQREPVSPEQALNNVLNHLERVKLNEARGGTGHPPLAPPIYWLRFGLTMVFCVGVALKDGPASLFVPRTTR